MPVAARTLCFILVAALVAGPLPAAEIPSKAVSRAATKATSKAPADPTGSSLEALLTGEFALQSGRLDDAAKAYLDAARKADDVALAERATRIALLAKDDKRAAEALSLWRKQGGEGLNLAAAEAVLAMRRGDDRAARRNLTQLLRAPGDSGWRQALGVLSGGSRDPKQSARLLKRLIEDGEIPNKLTAWLAFGGLAQGLEQPELVERVVAEVVKRFPGEVRVGLLRASQLREAGQLDEARKLLASLSAQAGDDGDLRRAIADEYHRMGDYGAAEAVLAQGPQSDQTYSLRAALLAQAEDKTTLTRLYDELRRDSSQPDPQRRLLLGQMAEFLERFDEALEWYRGVPGGPQRWPARLRSANVLHELDRDAEAFKLLHELQSDASVDDDARRDAYLLEASLYQKDKAVAAEVDAYARGLAAFPDDPEVLYARALSWERRDDIARAEADLRKILVAEPDNVAALNALGYTLADRTTRYQEALQLIERARTAEPDNPAIIDSYGWVLYRLGRKEDALVELRRALTMQKDAEIASHLAEVLWELGRKDEARKYFDQARKIDPENRALQRALQKTGA